MSRPTPRLCRVLLTGSALDGFSSLAPDDHVKVLFPNTDEREPMLPEVIGGRVSWPRDGRPIARDYTPVGYDAAARVLELHVVLHGAGPASHWAERASVGDVLAVAGPRASRVAERAPETLLLVGDETALPAMSRWLRELPAWCEVTMIVEVSDMSEKRGLETRARLVEHWVTREGAPGRALCAFVEHSELPCRLDHGWLAGEAGAIRTVREHLQQRGLAASRISSRGYWKLGVQDHQEPHDD